MTIPDRQAGTGMQQVEPDEHHARLVAEITEIGRLMRASDGRGGWSTGERIAGALICDEILWLPDGYTIPAAVDRLGHRWRTALIEAATGNPAISPSDIDDSPRADLVDRIRGIASSLVADNGRGSWSTGERIAGALLAGVPAWLPSGYSIVEAIARLSGNWLGALIEADRLGWRDSA